MKKAYIILGSRFGEQHVLKAYGFEVVQDMKEADFVVFTGGADISPSLYGEEHHPSVYCSEERDAAEIAGYKQAVELNLPMLGICRGAQLLNVLVGGSLYQDVNRHHHDHDITTDEGEVFPTTSVHHQMMRPTKEAIIKAWAQNHATYRVYMKDGQSVDDGAGSDPEIIIYPKQRLLLVQGHPEFGSTSPVFEQFRQYVFKLLKSL